MSTHVRMRGTFYEVGKGLGALRQSSIQAIVKHLKQSDFYAKIKEYLQTEEGGAVYKQLADTSAEHCSDYLDELRGVADGAEVNYDDIFVLNLGPDLTAALGIVPGGSHGIEYAAVFDGCTNIVLETDNKQVYLIHTEDVDPFYTKHAIVMSVEILGTDGDMKEKWTEYTIPGQLGGSKFGYNSHGVMFAHNNIYQKGLNKAGIRIASAFTFIFMKTDPTSGHVTLSALEAVGTEKGGKVAKIRLKSIYHHCNILQHLPDECHPEESSVHRAAVISQYINRGEIRTKDDLLKVVSDERDHVFPVYRSGNDPDYLQTGASGLFDAHMETLAIYLDKPSTSSPQHVLRIHE